ncbi:hypothetical protein [Mesobacillus selenatarsenatis]|uniref:Uncharacterized protein n=1 Tax=Mesobacillus selenatarsenatis (strain DSM 18680 / JCM 14380 / FERM P-15431 / SF-1) TaxID=1321606 RepID=A0A0A8X3U4_MESS1|nr:hypothetical protein [Mesobacillus selenatarsenatis]GAM14613.1 hypothetical protein SAMD00020551_2766 [Mesobacillus selenatarsenatis SF-1]
MKSLQDAIYNWLTIKIVSDARPEDTAAQETTQLFDQILAEEHDVESKELKRDALMYYVTVVQEGNPKEYRFPRDLIEVMLDQIRQEPDKYVTYPEED